MGDSGVMSDDLLALEARLLARNSELDALTEQHERGIEAAARAATPPPATPPRDTEASPVPALPATPLSPNVRQAAKAAANNRARTTPKRGPARSSPSPSTSRIPAPTRHKPKSSTKRSPATRRPSAGEPARSPLEHADDAAADLGLEAKVRYQKARMAVLRDERDHAALQRKEMEAELAEAKKQIAKFDAEREKLHRAIRAAENKGSSSEKKSEKASNKMKELKAEVSRLKKELDQQHRAARNSATENSSRDARLRRALEDNDKLKERLAEAESSSSQGSVALRRQIDSQKDDIRRLERQKTELLAAFKKQLRLIDILKRQKVHVEAARMLAFTEDEFAKTLEMGV